MERDPFVCQALLLAVNAKEMRKDSTNTGIISHAVALSTAIKRFSLLLIHWFFIPAVALSTAIKRFSLLLIHWFFIPSLSLMRLPSREMKFFSNTIPISKSNEIVTSFMSSSTLHTIYGIPNNKLTHTRIQTPKPNIILSQ